MRVMLDECITRKCAYAIIQEMNRRSEFTEAHFLIDFMGKQGAFDSDWTLRLTPPSDWIVISQDCGRQSPRIHAKGPPLPFILPLRGITGFFIAGRSLSQCKGEERAAVVISKLDDVVTATKSATPGSRFKIKRLTGRVVVEPWPILRAK